MTMTLLISDGSRLSSRMQHTLLCSEVVLMNSSEWPVMDMTMVLTRHKRLKSFGTITTHDVSRHGRKQRKTTSKAWSVELTNIRRQLLAASQPRLSSPHCHPCKNRHVAGRKCVKRSMTRTCSTQKTNTSSR